MSANPDRVLQGGARGPFVRSRRPPVQPRTTAQQLPRAVFKWSAATWLTLSEPEKDAWRSYGPVTGDGSVNIMVKNVPDFLDGQPLTPTAPSGGPPEPPVFTGGTINQTDNVLDLLTVEIEEPADPSADVDLYALAPQTGPEPETEDWVFLGKAWEGGIVGTDFLASYIDSFGDYFGPSLWIPFKAVTVVSAVESDPSFSALGTPPSAPEYYSQGALSSSGELTQLDISVYDAGEDNTTVYISVAEAQSTSSPQPTVFEFVSFYPYGSNVLLNGYVTAFGSSVPFGWWIWLQLERVSDFDEALRSDPVFVAVFVD